MINVALDSSSQSQISRWCFWQAKLSSMLACSMDLFHFSHSCAKLLVISLSSSISHTQWQRPYLKSLLTQATTIEFMSHVVPTVISSYLPHVVPKTLYMHWGGSKTMMGSDLFSLSKQFRPKTKCKQWNSWAMLPLLCFLVICLTWFQGHCICTEGDQRLWLAVASSRCPNNLELVLLRRIKFKLGLISS